MPKKFTDEIPPKKNLKVTLITNNVINYVYEYFEKLRRVYFTKLVAPRDVTYNSVLLQGVNYPQVKFHSNQSNTLAV